MIVTIKFNPAAIEATPNTLSPMIQYVIPFPGLNPNEEFGG